MYTPRTVVTRSDTALNVSVWRVIHRYNHSPALAPLLAGGVGCWVCEMHGGTLLGAELRRRNEHAHVVDVQADISAQNLPPTRCLLADVVRGHGEASQHGRPPQLLHIAGRRDEVAAQVVSRQGTNNVRVLQLGQSLCGLG